MAPPFEEAKTLREAVTALRDRFAAEGLTLSTMLSSLLDTCLALPDSVAPYRFTPWTIEVACTGRGNTGCGCSRTTVYSREHVIDTNPTSLVTSRKTYGVRCVACEALTDLLYERWPPDLVEYHRTNR